MMFDLYLFEYVYVCAYVFLFEFRNVSVFFINGYSIAGWKGNETVRKWGEREIERQNAKKEKKNDKMEKNVQNTKSIFFCVSKQK